MESAIEIRGHQPHKSELTAPQGGDLKFLPISQGHGCCLMDSSPQLPEHQTLGFSLCQAVHKGRKQKGDPCYLTLQVWLSVSGNPSAGSRKASELHVLYNSLPARAALHRQRRREGSAPRSHSSRRRHCTSPSHSPFTCKIPPPQADTKEEEALCQCLTRSLAPSTISMLSTAWS